MNNVSLISFNGNRIWLGKLNGEGHYGALVTWAQEIAAEGHDAKMPEILNELQFVPVTKI